MALNVGQEACQGKDPIWDIGLELCISGKDNNRANDISRQEI